MTTGTFTRDYRINKTYTCGPAQPGFYFQKVWSGADYPQEPLRAENVWVKPHSVRIANKLALKGEIGRTSGGLRSTYSVLKEQGYFKTVFHRPPRRALKAYHPYTATWNSWNDPEMTYKHPSLPLATGTVLACISGQTLSSDPWSSQDDLALLSKLKSKIQGSSFDAGIFLGEGKLALEMIGDSAIRIAKALSFVKKLNLKGAVAALTSGSFTNRRGTRQWVGDNTHRSRGHHSFHSPKSAVEETASEAQVANMWLQLQYGWQPLVSDMYDGAQFLAHFINEPFSWTVVVRRNAGGKHSKDSVNYPWHDTHHPLHHMLQSQGQIIAVVTEKDVAQLSGLTNPATLAWELLPYSFVVDWVTPIGSWLSARGLASSVKGTFVTTRTFRERLWEYRYEYPTVSGYRIDSPRFYMEQGRISRTVSTELSVPDYPGIKPLSSTASWKHCVSALALLSQHQSGITS